MEGKKYDGEKPRMYLLPPKALTEVAKVLTFGANKYDEHNWKKLDNLQNRYTGAALRHIFSHMDLEELDPETGLDHLAHAICCLLFKLEAKLETKAALDELVRLGQEMEEYGETSQEERSREFERFEYPESYTITFAGISDNEEGSVRDSEYSIQYDTLGQDYSGVSRTQSVCQTKKESVTGTSCLQPGDCGDCDCVFEW